MHHVIDARSRGLVLTALAAALPFLSGCGVRLQDAYVALDAAEHNLPRDAAQRERLLLANAQVDGPPPEGMSVERRLHPPGTLVRLRYDFPEEADGRGESLEVRAVVPPLPYYGEDAPKGPFGVITCTDACYRGLARTGSWLLQRTGRPGISPEWVLRMPVGKTFSLGRRSLILQDLSEKHAQTLPMQPVRVTLLEACLARPLLGSQTRLEVFPHATVPIPRGIFTRHWVQYTDCTLKPPPPPPETRAVKPGRSAGEGFADLRVDEDWLAKHGRPVRFRALRACLFDEKRDLWTEVAVSTAAVDIIPRAGAAAASRFILHLPRRDGLFWASWEESDSAGGAGTARSAMLPAGPVLCNDISLPPAPAGMAAACVPSGAGARARYVPLPCGP